ncbi:MAG: hypothetical protein JW910_07655 [Anaerolineae bacterium]|nr:hypothetical protein [Anaerolineae bacterium]
MDATLRTIIQRIHAAPTQAALVVSGGGSQALAWLLGVPGASHTVLEMTLPYSRAAFQRYLGAEPEQAVSRETALALAEVAYRRARILAEDGTPSVGLACTAALVTERPKRGEHRCHIAVRDADEYSLASLVLEKGARDRDGEEDVVSRLVLRALALACGLVQGDVPVQLLAGEEIMTDWIAQPDLIPRLLSGDLAAAVVDLAGNLSADLLRGVAVLPGSFNPLHGGHMQLAHVASQMLGLPLWFELSVLNVDKPPLAEAVIRQRLAQFTGKGRLLLTTAPLFAGKAALCPDSVFVIGYDTAIRLIDPQYYGGEEAAMRESLRSIRRSGGRFLVAGRLHEGRFHTLADVPVPPEFADLFTGIPPEQFRADISSTELRQWTTDQTPTEGR